jgi:hypothetical protein
MFEYGGTYTKKVIGTWGKAISGPVFGVLALVGTVLQIVFTDSPDLTLALKWGSWLTLGTAAFFVLVAQFHVWRDERRSCIALEQRLNAAADIRGPVSIQLSMQSPFADQTKPGSALGYTFDCSNHGKVSCEINKIIIKLAPPNHPSFNILQALPEPQVIEPGRAFKYQATCPVKGFSSEDLRKSKITVCAVDSIGREYQNTETKITNIVLQMPAPHAGRSARFSMRDEGF